MHGAAAGVLARRFAFDRSYLNARTLFVRRDVADSSAAFGVGMTTMKMKKALVRITLLVVIGVLCLMVMLYPQVWLPFATTKSLGNYILFVTLFVAFLAAFGRRR